MVLLEIDANSAKRMKKVGPPITFLMDILDNDLLAIQHSAKRHSLAIQNCPSSNVEYFRLTDIKETQCYDPQEEQDVASLRGRIIYYARR